MGAASLGFAVYEGFGPLGDRLGVELRVLSQGDVYLVFDLDPKDRRRASFSLWCDLHECDLLCSYIMDAFDFVLSQEAFDGVDKDISVGSVEDEGGHLGVFAHVSAGLRFVGFIGISKDSRKKDVVIGLDSAQVAELCGSLARGLDNLLSESSPEIHQAVPQSVKNAVMHLENIHGEAERVLSLPESSFEERKTGQQVRRKDPEYRALWKPFFCLSSPVIPLFVSKITTGVWANGWVLFGWLVFLGWVSINPGEWEHSNKDGGRDLRYNNNNFYAHFGESFVSWARWSILSFLVISGVLGALGEQTTASSSKQKKARVMRRGVHRSVYKSHMKRGCVLWGRDDSGKPIRTGRAKKGDSFLMVRRNKKSSKIKINGRYFWVVNSCIP